MKIKTLFKNIPVKQIKGSKDIDITGCCSNSKLVAPGNLFVAKPGMTTHGSQYSSEAVAAGAVAVLSDIYDPTLNNVVQIITDGVAKVEAEVANRYYQSPSQELFLVGITGTNGKTTTSYYVKEYLDTLLGPAGMIGTLEYSVGLHRYEPTHTTPDVATNQKMLREMVLQGCQSAVMEVTSHGLQQGRVANIDFDIAIFTNLTPDHLDYHQTLEEYCSAKNLLFRSLKPNSTAIINIDSPWHQAIVEGCKAHKFYYGIEEAASLKANNVQLNADNTTFDVQYKNHTVPCTTPHVGRFNIYNSLAAIAVGIKLGQDLEFVIEKIQHMPAVPGRLERVQNPLNLDIVVDFAHTPDALKNALETLRTLCERKLILVFGCGGDRDRTKRPQMGKVAQQFADSVIVTSDNPRTEDPMAIINEIVDSIDHSKSLTLEPNRYQAIQQAIEMAEDGDLILISGKGHETQQIFSHQTIDFDDRKVALKICQEKVSVNV